MKTIDLGTAQIKLIDDSIVLFEASPSTVIDKQAAIDFYNKIEQHVTGNYGLIIHRKNKYQLLRMEVFSVINSREQLAGMAIVAPKDSAQRMATIEAPLSQKPFEVFSKIDDAVDWLKTLDHSRQE
jgi:hypothetical protein